MRKYIGGLKYDTETATEISGHGYGFPSDHKYWDAGLYRTKSGRWFLAGHGNGMSRFSQPVEGNQNCWTGGSGIIPLTPDEAREILESDSYRCYWPSKDNRTWLLERYFADQLQDA